VHNVKTTDVLKISNFQNPLIQRNIIEAGLRRDKWHRDATLENPNIPEDIWFREMRRELQNPNRNSSANARRKLASRKLNEKQQRYILYFDRSTEACNAMVENNKLDAGKIKLLLKRNQPYLHVTLGAQGAHNTVGKQLIRDAMYNAGLKNYTASLKVLAGINAEEYISNLPNKPTNLSGANPQNIAQTFKLLNKTAENEMYGYTKLVGAGLLSSNPEYSKHLHLLNFKENTRRNLLEILVASIPTKQIVNLIQTETQHLTKREQQNYLNVHASLGYGKGPLHDGNALYQAQNPQTLEQIEKNLVQNAANTGLLHVVAHLLLNTHRNMQQGGKTQAGEPHIETQAAMLDFEINFGWGPKPTGGPRGEEWVEKLWQKHVEQTLKKAETNLGSNPAKWRSWIQTGWKTTEEAEENIKKLAVTP